jgi:hypothetical protein
MNSTANKMMKAFALAGAASVLFAMAKVFVFILALLG